MQSIISHLIFPEQQVKVGESFSVESPLSFPIAGVTIEMAMTTIYKLLSITNNIADFDVSQVYTMKEIISQYPITGTGSGKGKLLFDVSKDYFSKFQTDNELKINFKLDNSDLDLIIKTAFIQTTEITQNQNDSGQ